MGEGSNHKITNEKEVTFFVQCEENYKGSWDYYKQLHTNKMDNLGEMDKFLESYNLPRLNNEEIENMKRPITRTKIETVVKTQPTNISPG